MRLRTKITAVLATGAVAALTVGPAGASAQSPGVPTQQASETAEQYVQRLASLGYSGWLIPKANAPRRRAGRFARQHATTGPSAWPIHKTKAPRRR
jgi:hypothetical protein